VIVSIATAKGGGFGCIDSLARASSVGVGRDINPFAGAFGGLFGGSFMIAVFIGGGSIGGGVFMVGPFISGGGSIGSGGSMGGTDSKPFGGAFMVGPFIGGGDRIELLAEPGINTSVGVGIGTSVGIDTSAGVGADGVEAEGSKLAAINPAL
jgi:hypothetical protein